jgi:hypothetical protein
LNPKSLRACRKSELNAKGILTYKSDPILFSFLTSYMNQIGFDVNVSVGAFVVRNQNRIRMKELCRIAGSYKAAAALIADQTQRPLSLDSVKAWTCNASASRARTCPDWAIRALERKLQNI